MVELRSERYGVDLRPDKISLARASFSTGRMTVRDIVRTTPDKFDRALFNSEGQLYFSVAENESIVKKMKTETNSGLKPERVACFELAATLLDGEDKYFFDAFDIGPENEKLAVAYNRILIKSKITFFEKYSIQPAGFKLRSLAMAAAYRFFCTKQGGNLICLVDIENNFVSYCFQKDKYPILVGAFEGRPSGKNGDSAPDKLIVDLAATLNYQQTLTSNNIGSLPLSLIILTGGLSSEELAGKIESKIGVKTVLPSMKKEYFTDDIYSTAGKYLVALGMMVD